MSNRLKAYGFVVFESEDGGEIAQAKVTNNSATHRASVEMAMSGMLPEDCYIRRKLDRSRQVDKSGYGIYHPLPTRLQRRRVS